MSFPVSCVFRRPARGKVRGKVRGKEGRTSPLSDAHVETTGSTLLLIGRRGADETRLLIRGEGAQSGPDGLSGSLNVPARDEITLTITADVDLAAVLRRTLTAGIPS